MRFTIASVVIATAACSSNGSELADSRLLADSQHNVVDAVIHTFDSAVHDDATAPGADAAQQVADAAISFDARPVDARQSPDAASVDARQFPDAAPIDARQSPDAAPVDARPSPDATPIDAHTQPDAAPPPPSTVIATVDVSSSCANPTDSVLLGTDLWASCDGASNIVRIDTASRLITGSVTVGNAPEGITSDGTNLWVPNFFSHSVSKVDASTLTNVATVALPASTSAGPDNPAFAAYDGNFVWVIDPNGVLFKIDPVSNQLIDSITVGTSFNVVFDGSDLWVSSENANNVSKIDPVHDDVSFTITADTHGPTELSFDDTDLWVANRDSNSVSRIDRATDQLTATISIGVSAIAICTGGGFVWAASNTASQVVKIDPSTNTVVQTLDVGMTPTGVTFDGTNIWVANVAASTFTVIAP